MSKSLRHLLVYFCALLLPLQTVAAAHLSQCADLPAPKAQGMSEACRQSMTAANNPSNTQVGKSSHMGKSCWLGSICLAGMGMLALPSQHVLPHVAQSTPVFPRAISSYLSVIPEGPQRPPIATLR